MKIRKAVKKDISKITEIYIEGNIDEEKLQFPKLNKKEIKKDFEKRKKDIKKQLAKELAEKNRLFIVIEDKKEIIAIGQAYIGKDEGKIYGGLGRIYIKKEYRRKGIGTKITKFLIDYLKKKKVKEIESYVNTHNIPSLRLHKNFGFKPQIYKLIKKLK